MTKSKRQLRAEAVERLKQIPPIDTSGNRFVNALIGDSAFVENHAMMTTQDITSALIDLLTDDELPEGDALDLMRNLRVTEIMESLGIDPREKSHVRKMVRTLADMVERDYVRREHYVNIGGAYERLQAECDEWKARAERSNDGVKRSMTNLEWLYNYDEVFAAGVDYDNEREWLMSEHVDETCAENDMDAPGSPQNPRSREAGSGEHVSFDPPKVTSSDFDTRGKLEADVCKQTGWVVNRDTVFGWLDRQVAITERECRVDLKAENANLRSKLHDMKDALDMWRESYERVVTRQPLSASDGEPIEAMSGQVRARFMSAHRPGLVDVSAMMTAEQAVDVTLGCGECEDVTPQAKFCFTCGECGHVRRFIQGWNNVTDGGQDEFRFCPNCGRRVKEGR